jgi:hypothetical protein
MLLLLHWENFPFYTMHVINTKDYPPLKTASYRLAPAWKNQLKAKVKDFAAAGIIHLPVSHYSGTQERWICTA